MVRRKRPRPVRWQVEEYVECIGWRPAGDTGYCANCGRPQAIHEPWRTRFFEALNKMGEEDDDG